MRYLGLLLLCLMGSAQAGENITIKTAMGTTLQGYVAGPEAAGQAILLLHDRWGLNGTMRQWVDRFGVKGYRALAIDVFDGRASDEMGLATEIMNSVDPEWIKQDVLAGLKYLAAPRRVIATLGAGLGGWQSFQAALLAPERVVATVVIYGEMPVSPKEASRIRSPILAIFANDDPEITKAVEKDYFASLKKSQSTYRFIDVDAGHGFIDPLYPTYNPKKADEAWEQIDLFLGSNLGDL